MASPSSSLSSSQLLLALHETLHLNQKDLAALLGVSPRTVSRAYKGGMTFLPSTCEKLARACHPHDRGLAAHLAARAGKTLIDLGLEAPPPPAVLPPPRAPAALHRHVVDAGVSVAAEAMASTPQAMRRAVLAAFERAVALGMTSEEVVAAMAPSNASPAGKASKATKG
jgi:transcriptional regulator with XRE-family HTH domain